MCNCEVFILGRSPLPSLQATDVKSKDSHSFRFGQPWRSARRRPYAVLASIAALSILGFGLYCAVRNASDSAHLFTPEEKLQAHQEEGEKAWQAGDYTKAAEELRAARALRLELGEPTASESALRSEQMEHQADLVANSLSKPLADLLDEWQAVGDADLRKLFAERQGKTVAFDVLISRDGAGAFQYRQYLGRPLPRLELQDLTGLKKVPLGERQRMIFGVKLASLRRDRARPADDPERWVVGFQPDSFVPITDRKIAQALHLPIDDAMPEVLRRQLEFVSGRR
jgi:hypothetical protein